MLAASLAVVLLSNWILVQVLFRTAPWSMLGLVLILFLGLSVGSVIGLLMLRSWGFYCVYLLVPVSTILHGIPLVPFITGWLPSQELRTASVMALNVLFLVVAAAAHRMHRRTKLARGGAGAPIRVAS